MLGSIERRNRHKKFCFVKANGISYYVNDPYRQWQDGDIVSFIPGSDSKGPVAREINIIERGSNVTENGNS